ncbi:MAG: hypothetical protein AAGI14_10985 [Pseudomonadota bacterium]
MKSTLLNRLKTASPLLTLLMLSACGEGRPRGAFVEKVENTPSFYYRVEASYQVIETDEIVDFDFVVACGGQITSWSYTSPSVSISWYPNFIAQPTEDGAAIGIRVPKLCSDWAWGENWETNERDFRYLNPPDDFLPSTIWYPDVNFLGFGIGYESDIAYESPYSKLFFLDARVAKSNEAEWQAWRERAAADYKQVGAIPGPWGYSFYGEDLAFQQEVKDRNKGREIAGDTCRSVVSLDLTDKAREKLVGFVPEDRSRFWTPQPSDQGQLINILRTSGPYNDGSLNSHIGIGSELGVRRSDGMLQESKGVRWHTGGRFVNPSGKGNFYHDSYPVLISHNSDASSDSDNLQNTVRVILNEEWKGFSFCGRTDLREEDLRLYSSSKGLKLPEQKPRDLPLTGKNAILFDVYVEDQLMVNGVRWPSIDNSVYHILDGNDSFLNCCSDR